MSNTPNLKIPVLALRGLVIFPDMMIQFDIGRKKSVLALAGAMEGEHLIFLDAQTDLEEGEPSKEQLCRMGVVARIKQVIRHSWKKAPRKSPIWRQRWQRQKRSRIVPPSPRRL